MVAAIGSIFKPTTTSTTSSTQDAFQGNIETYLNLFLAQLKNQDPTAPFSTEAMTQQMSMLTQTQQSIQTNKNLEELIALNNNNQNSAVASFINKEVQYVSNEFYADDKGAEISFDVPEKGPVRVQIYDTAGKKIFESSDTSNAGKFTYIWDRMGDDGAKYETGKYLVLVHSQDSEGKLTELPATVKGKVSGIDFTTNGDPNLVIGTGSNKVTIGLDKVAFIGDVPVAAATGTTTDTATDTTTSDDDSNSGTEGA